jgi:type II secretion system protein H
MGMNMKASNRRSGFTLIELLVVIAIIGVLFAVAMPVFENAGRKNTAQAAYQLMSTMRLARQHAIANRQWTLVIFPNRDGGDYAPDDVDKCLRSYAVIAATNNLDGEYKFNSNYRDPQLSDMELEFVSDWKYLPDGMYFDDDIELKSNFPFGTLRGTKPLYSAIFQFPIDPMTPNDQVRPMSAVLFKPNGRAYAMSDSNSNGKFWQDTDYCRLYITAGKYYEKEGGQLGDPGIIPGGYTALMIRNKTGQVQILDDLDE